MACVLKGFQFYLHTNTFIRNRHEPYLPSSVDEYQPGLGRQRQVWLIPIADERVGVQVKL